MLTIAKRTLPLALFGPAGYGLRTGLLSAPSRVAQAVTPLGFAWALDAWGADALWLTAGLSLASGAALLALRPVREMLGATEAGGSRAVERGGGRRG